MVSGEVVHISHAYPGAFSELAIVRRELLPQRVEGNDFWRIIFLGKKDFTLPVRSTKKTNKEVSVERRIAEKLRRYNKTLERQRKGSLKGN